MADAVIEGGRIESHDTGRRRIRSFMKTEEVEETEGLKKRK